MDYRGAAAPQLGLTYEDADTGAWEVDEGGDVLQQLVLAHQIPLLENNNNRNFADFNILKPWIFTYDSQIFLKNSLLLIFIVKRVVF